MLPPSPWSRLMHTAFWTLCLCSYILEIWCALALTCGLQLLHMEPVIHDWPKEATFTGSLSFLAAVALIPFTLCLRHSWRCLLAGVGVWVLQFILGTCFPVF